jgi:transcriptional regulator with XRE-family HTH domain
MGEEEKAPVSSFLLDFGRVLKAERERQGLSLSDVSERCGVEKGAISRLENGLNANPTVDTIRRCAHALGKAITLRLTDEAGSTASPIQTDSASPTEELIPTRGPTDRRNWSMLLAKSMFWISIIEALENSCGGDAAIGLEVPADVRSDFADLFTSCSKWMAREGQRAGPTPGDEL